MFTRFWIVVLASLAIAALIDVGTAAASRTYECQITGSSTPSATECNGVGNSPPHGALTGNLGDLTIDSADNVWLSDLSSGTVSKYDSAGNFLAQIGSNEGAWTAGGFIKSLAYSNASGLTYVADSNHDEVWILNSTPAFASVLSGAPFGGGCAWVFAGADNSGTSSDGAVFVSSNCGGTVSRLDGAGNPSNFSGSAPYIDGNKLTGTPEHPFSFNFEGGRIAVDSAGHIIVGNGSSNVVDVFESSGAFLFEIKETPSGPFGSVRGVAADPTSDDILIVDGTSRTIEEFDANGDYVDTITGADTPAGSFSGNVQDVAVNSAGRVYVTDSGNAVVDALSPNVVLPKVNYEDPDNQTQTSGRVHATIDPNAGGDVIECHLEYGSPGFTTTVPCTPDPASSPPGSHFSTPTAVSADMTGLTSEQVYHYRFVVSNENGTRNGSDKLFVPHAVIGLTTDAASEVKPTSARLNGSWVGNGEDTHYYFQWGSDDSYGHSTPIVDQGSAPGPTSVSTPLEGLDPVSIYHYRIAASNLAGTSYGLDRTFTTPPNVPVTSQWVTDVHSDSVILHGTVNPGGGKTTYQFEYVPLSAFEASGYAEAGKVPQPESDVGSGIVAQPVVNVATGLLPDTTYRFRLVATNASDTTYGADGTFKTFPFGGLLIDSCPNALERKQTRTARLMDCRAYELVSAPVTNGFDVVSDLVPGGVPLPGYPYTGSSGRVLYTTDHGALPVAGNPTNFGPDPYVASRGSSGWTTRYVGLPANGTPSAGPFASPLALADASLSTFAFGGQNLCSPCFADGKAGIPVRLPDGSLVQGMAGALDPGAGATLDGLVAKPLSSDGEHVVFGSTSQFESGGNANGDASIYERDLESGATQVVSKDALGNNLACLQGAGACHSPADSNGIAELDISADGSRVLVAQKVSTDAAGNVYWHPYMHVGNAPNTIDLAPGAAGGVLYSGMSSDGTEVYFTTKAQLGGGDTDGSFDLYRADVATNSSSLTRVSTGTGTAGAGDVDTCGPTGNSAGNHWNAVGGASAGDCGVVAVGGQGGVSIGDGSVYFLSPERLDGAGNGSDNAPNLYLARPGASPHFIATIEPGNQMVVHGVTESSRRYTADFQTNPTGDDAVFVSALPITGYDNDGHVEIFRYDATTDQVDCASCAPTGVRATGNAALASNGNSVTADGRVFFTSTEPLSASDLNGKKDAYEYENGEVELISSGASPFDSGFFSVGVDGVDALFFTRDVLAAQDENGATMKLYDARKDGGFLTIPSKLPCQASDECHGPGTVQAPPPDISTVRGIGGNTTPISKCRPGTVRKHGKCRRKGGRHGHHRRNGSHRNG